jgi:hypothetical protein
MQDLTKSVKQLTDKIKELEETLSKRDASKQCISISVSPLTPVIAKEAKDCLPLPPTSSTDLIEIVQVEAITDDDYCFP